MADEIEVEGEPWTGLVVVSNTRFVPDAQGSYGLVQASEWKYTGDPKDPDRLVTVWNGPDKPDAKVERKLLVEVECRTVLVDEDGWYTCPPVVDLVKDEAVKMATEWFDNEANQRAAESQSYVDMEEYSEKYGEDIMAVAVFGDAVAINGESRWGGFKIPKGWVKVPDVGGYIPSGHEEEIDLDYITERIAEDITKELKRQVDKKDVEAILRKEFDIGRNYLSWTSDSGRAEVYVPKKALKVYEKQQEQEAIEEEKRRQQERIARLAKALEERKEKVRRGGFPRPKDWSPTGETDFIPPRE